MGEIASHDQGIVILAGVTGSGKTTSIAAMLQYINKRERLHIVTIEDPIEFTFKDDKCIINQREVGIDVIDWDTALKHAVRQDPDIILVGEMRDRETFNAAMHAAEPGHLVFGTIHASTAPSTISRILDLFPQDMHTAMRQNLAFNLKAIVAQKLFRPPRTGRPRPGRPGCRSKEIMRMNPTVKKLILTRKTSSSARPSGWARKKEWSISPRACGSSSCREGGTCRCLRERSQPRALENGAQRHHSPRARHPVDSCSSSVRCDVASLGRSAIDPPVPGVPDAFQERSLMTVRAVLATLPASLGGSRCLRRFPGPLPRCRTCVRGPGMYLNLFKFVPVVLIYLLWAWTTNWVERRHERAQQRSLRGLEQRGLFLGSARPGRWSGDSDLLHRAGPVVARVFRAFALPIFTPAIRRYPTIRKSSRPTTLVKWQRHLAQAGDEGPLQQGRRAPWTARAADRVHRQDAGLGQGRSRRVCAQAEESRSYMAAKELVYDAVLRRSTDIHLEPTTEQLSVRYRIDGILHAAEPFDRPTGDAVVNVFKVLSAMDISEKRKPQDGSFGAKLQGRELDFRVATSGSKAGEKLVMRILDNSSARQQDGRPGHAAQDDRAGAQPGDPAARNVSLLRPDRVG